MKRKTHADLIRAFLAKRTHRRRRKKNNENAKNKYKLYERKEKRIRETLLRVLLPCHQFNRFTNHSSGTCEKKIIFFSC